MSQELEWEDRGEEFRSDSVASGYNGYVVQPQSDGMFLAWFAGEYMGNKKFPSRAEAKAYCQGIEDTAKVNK